MNDENSVSNCANRMPELRRVRTANNAYPYPAQINSLAAFPPNFGQHQPPLPLLHRNQQVPLLNAPLPPPPGPPIIIDRRRIVPSRTRGQPMYQINFPIGTRVGLIEFISPNGASQWIDSSGFTVVIGNVRPHQNAPRYDNLFDNNNQRNQFRERVKDARPVEERIEGNQIVPNDAVPLGPVAPEPPLLNGPRAAVNQVGGEHEDILLPARAMNALNNAEPLVPVVPVDQQHEIEPARAVADNQVIDNVAIKALPNVSVCLDVSARVDSPVLPQDLPMNINDGVNNQNGINLPVVALLASNEMGQVVPVSRSPKEVTLSAAKIKNSASILIPEIGGSKNKNEIKSGLKSSIAASRKHKPTLSTTDRPKKKRKQQDEKVSSANVSPAQLPQAQYDLYCWVCHVPHFYIETNKLSKRRCECGLICHEACVPIMFPQEAPQVGGLSPATGQYNSVDLSAMVGKCRECMCIEAGAVYNRQFGFEMAQSSILFTYASVRLTQDLKFICFKNFNANEHVVRPMDLNTIATKSETGIYRSTDEFILDLKLAIHNSYIIRGTTKDDYDYATLGRDLLQAAREEFAYMNMCSGCYRNYYEIDDAASHDMTFEIPCDSPHGLVWAQKESYWFPAKVYEYRAEGSFVASQELVSIIFFGTGKSGPIQVKPNQLYMYSKKFPTPQPQYCGKVKLNFMKAQKIATQYVINLDNFFVHNYKVPDNAAPFDWEEIYITVGEPKDRSR